MLKYLPVLLMVPAILFSCRQHTSGNASNHEDDASIIHQISNVLDSFNRAAASADFATYFNFYTDDAIFTGTDATERWNKNEFMNYARPHFDKGKAWNFTSVDRHIFLDTTKTIAWFDELLSTQMKLCRGSGVLVKTGNGWKLKQYILSATIPNPTMDSVVRLKTVAEDSLIDILRQKK